MFAKLIALAKYGRDCIYDGLIAGASAKISGNTFANVGAGECVSCTEQFVRRQQHAGRAESALCCVTFGEGRLQLRKCAAIRHYLDCIDPLAVSLYRKHQASACDFAIDQHRACAADAMLTSKMGPSEFKLLAEEISQMLAGIDQSVQLLAVDDRVDFEFVLHPPITPGRHVQINLSVSNRSK